MIDILFDDVASGDEIDYKRAYENSCKAVDNMTKSLDEAKKEIFRRELDLIALEEQTGMIEKYEFGFRVVEAFLGAKILEDYE